MTEENREISVRGEIAETSIRDELEELKKRKRRKTERFILSALSSIPWIGGFLSASANFDAESEQGHVNDLQRQWLEEHKRKIEELARTLSDIAQRIESLGPEAEARAETSQYSALVRKAFGVWDRADTSEKRDYVRRLLSNAAGTTLADDDLVRLFIQWIDQYHEVHFAVIRAIYRHPGCTRAEIWGQVYGRPVPENSAEADLFKLLIRDLSTGSVIRQHRDMTPDGQFLKKQRVPVRRGTTAPIMKSAFDDTDAYELTELGAKFVHYVLSDVVPRIGSEHDDAPEAEATPNRPSV
jgi:hypothetical protein